MSPASFSVRFLMVSASSFLLISPRWSCSSRSNSSCSRCSFYACGDRPLRAATKSRTVLVAYITPRPAVGEWPNNSSRTCFLFCHLTLHDHALESHLIEWSFHRYGEYSCYCKICYISRLLRTILELSCKNRQEKTKNTGAQ